MTLVFLFSTDVLHVNIHKIHYLNLFTQSEDMIEQPVITSSWMERHSDGHPLVLPSRLEGSICCGPTYCRSWDMDLDFKAVSTVKSPHKEVDRSVSDCSNKQSPVQLIELSAYLISTGEIVKLWKETFFMVLVSTWSWLLSTWLPLSLASWKTRSRLQQWTHVATSESNH